MTTVPSAGPLSIELHGTRSATPEVRGRSVGAKRRLAGARFVAVALAAVKQHGATVARAILTTDINTRQPLGRLGFTQLETLRTYQPATVS